MKYSLTFWLEYTNISMNKNKNIHRRGDLYGKGI